jgi:hypothetical protein
MVNGIWVKPDFSLNLEEEFINAIGKVKIKGCSGTQNQTFEKPNFRY